MNQNIIPLLALIGTVSIFFISAYIVIQIIDSTQTHRAEVLRTLRECREALKRIETAQQRAK